MRRTLQTMYDERMSKINFQSLIARAEQSRMGDPLDQSAAHGDVNTLFYPIYWGGSAYNYPTEGSINAMALGRLMDGPDAGDALKRNAANNGWEEIGADKTYYANTKIELPRDASVPEGARGYIYNGKREYVWTTLDNGQVNGLTNQWGWLCISHTEDITSLG